MALYTVHVKRIYHTDQVIEALIVDSKTREQRYYNSQMLIEMILNKAIHVNNLAVKRLSSGELRLVLCNSHFKHKGNYSIARKNCGNNIMEENFCIVVNGWKGIYECLYCSGFGDHPLIDRIISTTDGIRLHVNNKCKENNTGFKFFNAVESTSREFTGLKLLDIVNDELEDIECFKMQSYRESGIFKRKRNLQSQSYFDFGYTRDCEGVTNLTKEVFNTIYKQNAVFKRLENTYGKEFVPVFNMHNNKINMIAIYGDCSSYLKIVEGIGRIELNDQYSDLLEHIVINAPNGIDLMKLPYNTKSVIIVSKAGAKIRINKPFIKKSKRPEDTRKYIDKVAYEVISSLSKNSKDVEDIVIESMNNKVKCKQSNIEVNWFNASEPMIAINVVSGIQRITDNFYTGSEIYIIESTEKSK